MENLKIEFIDSDQSAIYELNFVKACKPTIENNDCEDIRSTNGLRR